MTVEVKKSDLLTARELLESGVLQEVNRRLLHPRGLALMISWDEGDPAMASFTLSVTRKWQSAKPTPPTLLTSLARRAVFDNLEDIERSKDTTYDKE